MQSLASNVLDVLRMALVACLAWLPEAREARVAAAAVLVTVLVLHSAKASVTSVFMSGVKGPLVAAEDPPVEKQNASQEETPRQMTCAICGCDDAPPEEFKIPTVECQHENDVCKTCLGHHLAANLDRNNTDSIRCCGGGGTCDNNLSADDLIRMFGVTHEIVLRYNDVIFKNMLSDGCEFLRCAWDDCDSFGQEVAGGAEAANFLTCNSCQRKTCVHHRCKWHDGMTCQEYDLKQEAEAAAAKALADTDATKAEGRAAALAAGVDLKECPKCAMPFTREAGCPIMRCCGRGGDDACKKWTQTHPDAPCNHNPLGGEHKYCGHRFCIHCLGAIFADGRGDHDYCCPMHPINSGVESLDDGPDQALISQAQRG